MPEPPRYPPYQPPPAWGSPYDNPAIGPSPFIPNALNLPAIPTRFIPPDKYIRQILQGEPNQDLRYVYFDVLMADGQTPAFDETGGQPEINITNTGWSSVDIGLLETVGYGRYRALLSDTAVSDIGVIVTRYIGTNTLETFGESIEIVANYRQIDTFDDSCSPKIISYLNIGEAESYFSMRLHNKDWVEADPEDKIKALVLSTRDIENLAFSGWKTDPNQLLEFPRNGLLTIPKQIKQAQAEISITYLSGYDSKLEYDSIAASHSAFFSVRETIDTNIAREAVMAGINNQRAWVLLKPFLRDPRLLKIVRMS